MNELEHYTREELISLIMHHEAPLNHLDDMIPCLDELIESFDESYGEE